MNEVRKYWQVKNVWKWKCKSASTSNQDALAIHLPTEQRRPAFIISQKLLASQNCKLCTTYLTQPKCRKFQKRTLLYVNYRKTSPALQKWLTIVTLDNQDFSLNNPSCFISLPQPSNVLTNSCCIYGALASTSLSLGAQQCSYTIQELIMLSRSSLKKRPQENHTVSIADDLKNKQTKKTLQNKTKKPGLF